MQAAIILLGVFLHFIECVLMQRYAFTNITQNWRWFDKVGQKYVHDDEATSFAILSLASKHIHQLSASGPHLQIASP